MLSCLGVPIGLDGMKSLVLLSAVNLLDTSFPVGGKKRGVGAGLNKDGNSSGQTNVIRNFFFK